MKKGMLKNGAADSGMLKLLQKKTACWRYKNGMLKNGAAESGKLKKNPACWNCWKKIRHVETATDKKRHVEGMKKGMLKNGAAESGMLKLLQKKNGMLKV